MVFYIFHLEIVPNATTLIWLRTTGAKKFWPSKIALTNLSSVISTVDTYFCLFEKSVEIRLSYQIRFQPIVTGFYIGSSWILKGGGPILTRLVRLGKDSVAPLCLVVPLYQGISAQWDKWQIYFYFLSSLPPCGSSGASWNWNV